MKIENLHKSYGKITVFDRFNLETQDDAVTCILGESGSGKTTLLNAVAGLTEYSGSITPVKCSYIFQSPRLIPNLTVLKNLQLVCQDRNAILCALQKAGIADKANAYPIALSGGQAQRVAILRAFLYRADIVLMDEPFSSLDLKLKIKMMELFNGLRRDTRVSALFVTHDVDEAVYLADRILVISGGKIICDVENCDKGNDYGLNSAVRERLIQALLN